MTKEFGVIDVIVQPGFAKTYKIIICVYYFIYKYYLLSIFTKHFFLVVEFGESLVSGQGHSVYTTAL